MPCGGLELELSQVEPAGGVFSFSQTFSEPLAGLPFSRTAGHIRTYRTPRYLVYVDLQDIEIVGKYQPPIVQYNLYAEPRPPGSGLPTAFTFTGRAMGSFPPQTADVKVFVGEAPPLDDGTIELPIFPFEATRYVTIPNWEESKVVDIDVPGGGEIILPLKNQLRLPVTITVQQPSRGKLWHRVALQIRNPSDPQGFVIKAGEEIDDALVLEMVPSSAAVLGKVLFPQSARPIEIRAALNTRPAWGLDGRLPITIVVRMVPMWYLTFGAVAIGAVIGSAIPVAAGRRQLRRWPRALLVSFLVGLAAEALAMLLFLSKTQVSILGFTIDPFQLLPACVLGLLAGLLGFRSYELFHELVPKLFRRGAGRTS